MLLCCVTQIFNLFCFCSNKFANEKVKLEELIKKSQDDLKEHEKRAVTAEVQTKKPWNTSVTVWTLQIISMLLLASIITVQNLGLLVLP